MNPGRAVERVTKVLASKRMSHTWFVVFGSIALAMTYAYVFSYAPAVRYQVEYHRGEFFRPTSGLDGRYMPIYKPVDCLIDNTSSKELMLWWADLWGVKADFQGAIKSRDWERTTAQRP